MAKVCPLFSGSSGNSYYIGTGEHGILVDAGRTAKQMEGALSANDINISSVRANFLSPTSIPTMSRDCGCWLPGIISRCIPPWALWRL